MKQVEGYFLRSAGSFLHFTEHEESHETVEGMLTEASVDCGEQSVKACALFLRRCLRLVPEERPTARELIEDPWLADVPN
jgi:serine/threonine-protein kinase SRPK3